MSRAASLQLLAPGLIDQTWNEAEALGSAAWLWLHSAFHREAPLHAGPLLVSAIKLRQFILAIEDGRPVFYLSWACFDEAAESRYLSRHPVFMPEADWQSGDRLWILDWVAPFGDSHAMARLLERPLWANRCAYHLYHRGDERGLRIKTFHGAAVPRAQAQHWFETHPVNLPTLPTRPFAASQQGHFT